MDNSIMNLLPFDPAYILIGMAVVIIILLIITTVLLVKTSKLKKKYNLFLKGKNGENLEESFLSAYEEIKRLQTEDEANKEAIKAIKALLYRSYQRSGLVKYDAFKGMGGKSSFALVLLTQGKNGYIVNSIHGRDACSVYVKEVVKGECEITLSKEEREALDIALGNK